MPVYQFQMMEPDGEFVGVMRGLIFEGHLLACDPTYNVAEWVPIHGTVSDFSPIEESSLCELSNIMLLEEMNGTPRMEQFSESQLRHASAAIPVDRSLTPEAETQ